MQGFPVYALQRASILDFRPRLGNRCKVLPVYALLRASILDFKARLGNRCKVLPVYVLLCASILDFRSRLANRCSVLAAAVRNGPPTVVVAATRSVSDSNFLCGNREWFRLLRSLRQRVPRPILFCAAAKKNGSACSPRRDKGPCPILFSVAARENGFACRMP